MCMIPYMIPTGMMYDTVYIFLVNWLGRSLETPRMSTCIYFRQMQCSNPCLFFCIFLYSTVVL